MKDLIDRVAEALPVEVRAEYYRELRHCRSLPENDEMLRILRAMQFLVLLIHEAPARLAAERSQLQEDLTKCVAALDTIGRRLDALPTDVASGLSPEQVAARINESLRQQFMATTIPDTGRALQALAAQLKDSVAAFVVSAREIAAQHNSTAREARAAVNSIESAVHSATAAAREANNELARTLLHFNWATLGLGAAGVYLLGVLTAFVWFR